MYRLQLKSDVHCDCVRACLALLLRDSIYDATLVSSLARDRLADLHLQIDGKVDYDGMQIQVIEKQNWRRDSIHLLITSETRDLMHMRSFVSACEKWYYDTWRPSIGPRECLQIYTWWNNNNDWMLSNCIEKKKLDTIFFDKKPYLDGQINKFLKASSTGSPADRTKIILLHGASGTGKTALMQAIASKHSLAMAQMDLGVYHSRIEVMIRRLPLDNMLCIEDIDSLYLKDTKNDAAVSLSKLCSSLDDFSELKHLLIFMTATNVSNIDTRLRRKIDIVIDMPACRLPTAEGLFKLYRPDMTPVQISLAAKQVVSQFIVPATLEKYLRGAASDEFVFEDFKHLCDFHKDSSVSLYA